MKKLGLLPKIIVAIAFGIFAGLFLPKGFVKTLVTFNGLFGNFLDFVIPLIILGFIAPGIGDLGDKAGKLLALTAGIAYSSTIIAGTFAFFSAKAILPSFLTVGSLDLNATDPSTALLEPLFMVEMPAVFGVMTALLLAFIIGLGIAFVKGDTIKKLMNEFQEIISKVINNVIIPLLPIHIAGIFANMAFTGQVFTILSVFLKVFLMILVLHFIILLVQFSIAGAISGGNPIALLINMIPAYFTAIGTQSSAATIPVTLQQTKKGGVTTDIADFVIPLCATIHLSGSTITLVTCSIAIMMLTGTTVGFQAMLPFILMLGVTMVAAPGVPGGAVMAALGLLESMLGFSQPMLSLMIALYIAQDSFGTAANITGDAAIAVIVNKFSGNKLKAIEK